MRKHGGVIDAEGANFLAIFPTKDPLFVDVRISFALPHCDEA
jgi:hypothetical protein